jgi:enoyl-CoA hydratase/carnithine racemase
MKLYHALSLLVASLLAAAFVGCGTVPTPGSEVTVGSVGKVAARSGSTWTVQTPPELRFTGVTMTAREAQRLAYVNGATAIGVHDAVYAQVEAESAKAVALWLKRLMWDIGYDYRDESRDCDNFARAFRVLPDLFADAAPGAQAAVFGLSVEMSAPFAGITDGLHALNLVWTDDGWFVFEPQGAELVYQAYAEWPNRHGILQVIGD